MRAAPYWPGKTPPWYGRFTPAESTRYTIGMRWRIAISWARSIFLIVSGHQQPAFTVASFATTTTGRPAIRPRPVTTPAPGACPSYWSNATSRPISNQVPPWSSRASIRSRAVSFPCSCWRRTLSGPPPCSRRALSSRYSAVRVLRRLKGDERRGTGTGSRRDMLGCPLFDVFHQIRRGRARSEQPPDTVLAQRCDVLRRNDPAARHQHVVASGFDQQLLHAREQGQVGAGEDRQAHHVHVLLDRRLGDHFGGLVQPRVDDLHAGVTQGRGHDLRTAVVPVQAGLGDQHPNGALRAGHQRRNRTRPASPSTTRRARSSYTTSTWTRWARASSTASSMRRSSSCPSASSVRTCPRCSALSVGSMPFTAQPVPTPSRTASACARSQARSRSSRNDSAASRTSAAVTRLGFTRTTPSTRSWRYVCRCGSSAAASTPMPATTSPAGGRWVWIWKMRSATCA